MLGIKPLNADSLYQYCDPNQFRFLTTEELDDLNEIIGQTRALEALHFGIGIQQEGYNLFVLGPAGTGKHTLVKQYLERIASDSSAPSDWCYVNNFEHPDKPYALQLPEGRAGGFRRDMAQLIEDLRTAIPVAFEAEEYHTREQEIENALNEKVEQQFNELSKDAEQVNISLLRTPHGFAFAPLVKNEVISPEKFKELPKSQQKSIEKVIYGLEEKLKSFLSQRPQWQRQIREKIKTLNREVAVFATEHLIHEIRKSYQDLPAIQTYLDAVYEDVIENLYLFRSEADSSAMPQEMNGSDTPPFRRYEVNVMVDHSSNKSAPVIYEDNPLYQNLVGRVEHTAQFGNLVTDFTLIKPGALHRANGGFLILDASKLLVQPYSWEGLKRALSSREIRIQALGQIYSLVSTVSLEPEPIPLNLKVVLVGEPLLYYLLHAYDPEFAEQFKVSADFEDRMDRSAGNNKLYAQLIATIARQNHLRAFDVGAVARIIEYSARLVGDSERLSAHLRSIADLLTEADFWAHKAECEVIDKKAVQSAIDAQIRRSDRIRDRVYEEIKRGTILIDTDGEMVAQINGLAVVQLGNFAFAQPSRITATARFGKGEVIDIEREVKLGGAIHSKGVFILSSFLSARFGKHRPLSLTASLVFEQSYGMIDGDSASLAELCALLSALAEAPLKQSLAITGSINQLGQAQAIGGVNEKIEGFFDVCKATKFTGGQGVIIPASNVKHLMLREDVVKAVKSSNFSIYAIKTIDEAIELLTGVTAGQCDEQGNFPKGSLNHRVEERLITLEKFRKEFSNDLNDTSKQGVKDD